MFDNQLTLRREFDSIIRAAAMDAIGLPEVATPSRRARRFVDRADRVRDREAERARWRAVAGVEPPVAPEVEALIEWETASEGSEGGERKVNKVKKRKREGPGAEHGISKEVIESSDEEL